MHKPERGMQRWSPPMRQATQQISEKAGMQTTHRSAAQEEWMSHELKLALTSIGGGAWEFRVW
jgi:hypothetical protein